MKIDKLVTITEEKDLKITGITLLSKEEAEAIPKEIRIRIRDNGWWLRTPAEDFGTPADRFRVAVVSYDNWIHYDSVYCSHLGVCPALKISGLESSNLSIGEKFILAEQTWTIISESYALCDEVIGECNFCEDDVMEDANNYEKSFVKRYIEKWAADNGLVFDQEV